MDNYNLSNLPLSGYCADFGEHHPWLTDEENRRVTFSGRSATVSTSEQVERQQLPSTGDEQIPEQKVLANFDISLASTHCAATTTADEPEDPFAALAAYAARAAYHYQLLTLNDDTGQPLNSNLGLGNINASSEAVLADLEGNYVVELSEQLQGESDTQGMIIFESTIPETVSDKRSGKRRAPEPRNVVTGDLPESVISKSSLRSDRLTGKRQKLDSTDTEFLPLPRGTATESQAAAMPEKLGNFREYIRRRDPDESLRMRVEEETNRWIIEREGLSKRYMCGYPDCGWLFSECSNLRTHIFRHIQISMHRCTYPECSDNPYFRNSYALKRHVRSCHTHEKRYHCEICKKCLGRLDNYKKHMSNIHKMLL